MCDLANPMPSRCPVCFADLSEMGVIEVSGASIDLPETDVVPYGAERRPLDDTLGYQCPSCGTHLAFEEVPCEDGTRIFMEVADDE